ncbi:MAG: hypothetical protein ACE5KF_11015 [Kiloniellaceae bacterium]
MSEKTTKHRIVLTALLGGFAVALIAAPLAPRGDLLDFRSSSALAKGNGGGQGRGDAHGRGAGHGPGGQTLKPAAWDGEDGPGHGLALGHDKDAVSGVAHQGQAALHPENQGALTSLLGRLNAAHASDRAKAVQLEHFLAGKSASTVGLIAAYEAALLEAEAIGEGNAGYDAAIDDAVANLLAAANKSVADLDESTAVVQGVDSLLGLSGSEVAAAETGVGASGAETGVSASTEQAVAEGFLAGQPAGGGVAPAPQE